MDTELSVLSGRADMYACHRVDPSRHLVIELKATNDDRHVVGQLLDYIATIAEERNILPATMSGLILCPSPSTHLELMVSRVDGVCARSLKTLEFDDPMNLAI
jgi:hypothetical protein